MIATLAIILAILIAVAVTLYLHRRRVMRALHRAVFAEQTFIPENMPGATNREWCELLREVSELISENQHLQRMRSSQIAQFEATLGNLQEAVLIIDSDNAILLANKALQSFFPGAGAALHQRFECVIHSASFLEYVENVRKGAARPQYEIGFMQHEHGDATATANADASASINATGKSTATHADSAGMTHWMEVTGAAIPSGEDTGGPRLLFVFHDVTRLKKLEVVRKEFVANVSHELRTPLSLVKGCAETLVEGHTDMPVADRDRFLRTIQRHSERLNTLIEDLLVLSRLESANPGLRREHMPFGPFVDTIVGDYRARATAASHQITISMDTAIGTLNIDSLKLTQVFENLLDNALKYTPPGSIIAINARLKKTSSNNGTTSTREEVEVSVKDNGPGIPARDLPHMFERFYRVDKGRSRETGGTGLGLSIVKHIVQLHGGRVRVESEPGRGATFYFTLPTS